jgi:hypothetical protein
MEQAVVTRNLEPGQTVTFDDVEIPDTFALKAWKWAEARAGEHDLRGGIEPGGIRP